MLFIALAVVAVYSNTLNVPFYLDDYSSIVDNPVIYDRGGLSELWQYSAPRIAGYSTFALNFRLNHLDPTGYHVVNILIHILAGLSLFILTRVLLQTPAMTARNSETAVQLLPLFAGLLFVVHPLQTQAVTYVVQRLASLSTLWYLAALACYVSGRLEQAGRRRLLLFALSFLCGVLAFFTKQSAYTLPLVIVAIEFVFFPLERRRTLLGLAAAFGAGLLLWGMLVFAAGYQALSPASLDAFTRETTDISRFGYFLTQLKVLWVYIRLFFWPVGLHLVHDVPLAQTVLSWSVIAAFVGHVVVLTGTVLAVRRFPLFAFGILFYYITHLVESSFFPIKDVIFEHRSYLPNAGLCLSAGSVLFILIGGKKNLKFAGYVAALAILLTCSVLTWQRNALWQDPVALWHDSAVNAPNVARPWNEYARCLIAEGKNKEAIAVFLENMKRFGSNESSAGLVLDETAAVNFMMVLAKEGRTGPAMQIADDFLARDDIQPLNRSKMLTNRGTLFLIGKRYGEAEKSYRQAIEVYGTFIKPINNLGMLLMREGRLDEAEAMFLQALEIDPKSARARKSLNQVQQMKRVRQ
jgi:tetratricopeptide (TPR) repeat protein